jgi:hypothetical protein
MFGCQEFDTVFSWSECGKSWLAIEGHEFNGAAQVCSEIPGSVTALFGNVHQIWPWTLCRLSLIIKARYLILLLFVNNGTVIFSLFSCWTFMHFKGELNFDDVKTFLFWFLIRSWLFLVQKSLCCMMLLHKSYIFQVHLFANLLRVWWICRSTRDLRWPLIKRYQVNICMSPAFSLLKYHAM